MLTLKKLIDTQKEFNQGRFVDYATVDLAGKQVLTKDYILHALDEFHEVLRIINWKMHKKNDGAAIDEFELAVELIDVLKFWSGIAALWGKTPEELELIYDRKTAIVGGRYEIDHRPPPSGPMIYVNYEWLKKSPLVYAGLIANLCAEYDGSVNVTNCETSEDKFFATYLFVGMHNVACYSEERNSTNNKYFAYSDESYEGLKKYLAATLRRIVG